MTIELQKPTGGYKNRDDMVAKWCPGKVCAEVGVLYGNFSKVILAAKPAMLWLVDPWQHQPESVYPGDTANLDNAAGEVAYQNVRTELGMRTDVTVRRGYSFDVAQEFPDGHFDFVFLDAVHTMPMALSDMVAWWPKVKTGGWLCGHDLNLGEMPGCPALQVALATQHFLQILRRDKLDIVPDMQDSWGIRK